jgi:ribokinase
MREYILAVGSINMDLVIRTPHYPQPGETVLGGSFQTFPGGKGANQAVAAARLDAKVLLIGRVGQDGFGDAMLQTIQNDRVDIQCIQRDPELPTGVAFILVDDTTGQNVIVLAAGANSNVTPLDIAAYAPLFKQTKVLMMNLECPLAAIEKAVELAKLEQDIIVVLNPALPPIITRIVTPSRCTRS